MLRTISLTLFFRLRATFLARFRSAGVTLMSRALCLAGFMDAARIYTRRISVSRGLFEPCDSGTFGLLWRIEDPLNISPLGEFR